MEAVSFKQIGEVLKTVYDPEIRINVADLGLVYGARLESAAPGGAAPAGTAVKIIMSLTTPACPYGPALLASVHGAIAKIPGVRDVDVDLSFSPTWDPRIMASEEAKDQLGIF